MKVCHILRKYNPSEWGGTETAVLNLLRGLDSLGVTNEVWAPKEKRNGGGRDLFAEHGHHVRRFHAFLPELGISKSERRQRTRVGGNIVSLDLPRHLFTSDADIFHTHSIGRLGATVRTVAKLRGKPYVATIHGGYLDLPEAVRDTLAGPKGRFTLDYGRAFGAVLGARRVLVDAAAVITCNPREAELIEERMHNVNVVRMPHGIPTDDFSVESKDAKDKIMPEHFQPALLVVGRIDSVKNQVLIAKGLVGLRKVFPKAGVVFAGPVTDEAHSQELQHTIEEHNLVDHVVLPGGIPYGDPKLIQLYRDADILVLPSLSETFGLVLIEAWAAGTAVIATPTSGAKQVIEDEENGFFFDWNEASFIDAVQRTMESPSRNAMINKGRQHAIDHYDISSVASQFESLYSRVRRKRIL